MMIRFRHDIGKALLDDWCEVVTYLICFSPGCEDTLAEALHILYDT